MSRLGRWNESNKLVWGERRQCRCFRRRVRCEWSCRYLSGFQSNEKRTGKVQSYECCLLGATSIYATYGYDTESTRIIGLASWAFQEVGVWNRCRRVSLYYRHDPRYRSQANLVYPVSLPIPLYLSTSLISSEHNKRAFSCFFSQLVDKRNDDDDRRPCAGIKLGGGNYLRKETRIT